MQQYLLREYPQENARCEWKEYKNLKNSFCGDDKNDVISYVSAFANMEGGHLVIGVKDKTLEIVRTNTKASLMFKKVHSRIPAEEVNDLDVQTFLSKCGLIRNGGVTRAAIILLGKYESAFKLRPAVAQVTWTRRDKNQEVVDYEHFTVPFILTVDEILSKIENLTLREMPGGTLFPDTMKQYDDYTIREALHNCIAHQDYTL